MRELRMHVFRHNEHSSLTEIVRVSDSPLSLRDLADEVWPVHEWPQGQMGGAGTWVRKKEPS